MSMQRLSSKARRMSVLSSRLASRLIGVRIEELLTVQLVGADRSLPFLGNQPVDEGLALLGLDVLVALGIDQDHAILVEEAVIAFDQNLQVTAVLKSDPGAAIGQGIGRHLRSRVKSRPHAGAGLSVPASPWLDVRSLPDCQLRLVRAGIVTPGGKGAFALGDGGEGGDDVAAATDFSRVGLGADD